MAPELKGGDISLSLLQWSHLACGRHRQNLENKSARYNVSSGALARISKSFKSPQGIKLVSVRSVQLILEGSYRPQVSMIQDER